jgi:hypothetical protein
VKSTPVQLRTQIDIDNSGGYDVLLKLTIW